MSQTQRRRTPPTGSVTGYGYGKSQHPHIDEIDRTKGDLRTEVCGTHDL
jgi:hypothetical protein